MKKMPFERECMYCGCYFTPQNAKGQYCKHRCSQRHYKERAKRRKLAIEGFIGVYPIDPIKPKAFYTIDEVCEFMTFSPRTLNRLIKEGHVRAFKAGKILRIPAESILKLMKTEEDESNNQI